MQAPRLVATDVDGTLLDPADRVPPRAVAVIERLRTSGTEFVLVTGRPPRWIPPVTEQLGRECLAVCANGAVLYDGVTDRVVWSRALDVDTLATLAAAAAEALPLSGVAVERVPTRAFDERETFLAEPDYLHAWPGRLHVASRVEVLSEPAVKLLVRCPGLSSEAMVAALAPLIDGLADATFSTPNGLVELAVPGVTKATGLAEVAQRLGVDRDEVVAFGDMPNDLEMLCWAGHGVAMGNAHPALLEIADEVTAHHGEDGLAVVLERWF
ncbi:HAD family hydrolase [Pseudonocardia sp.]|uniref:HAD family hydrolase n=1 Tax=Pseudonocardia sp. TaxID=60912 RepID=UPI003D0C0D46